MLLKLKINGKQCSIDVDPSKRLLDVIREDLKLTGTKEGCSEGECGACTVIMNGKAVNSCMLLAVQARESDLITVEGLEKDGELDELQKAFIEKGAVQCGFCTPGMLMSLKALLMQNPNPSDDEIRIAIEGNLCRCTGYVKIVEAVKEAIKNNVVMEG
ncbi:(2Fe-2S)-binding protein [Clostridium bowmanii]|uniref:(2Fe-2S)-binding protein n=1 Tax=Clostridium bowmanii TaxID=132925 RepID=UPI001C0C5E74|nr:(2Fe-2S)-binding protein [Clostridium bowmanii]MBU3188195.1 (2Fe-2S)-binding protein [Clostridium bowmanii]MCA1072377.1 (2Fe-2S)-binding protein [Clostridium bowmanii]